MTDTLYINKTILDTLSRVKTDSANKNSDIDTLVTYDAKDSIIYNIPEKTTTLYGKAKIIFRTWKIEAEIINIDWTKNSIYAKGIMDPKDSSKQIGLPEFTENNETYKGMEVTYNFKSKSGVVKYGETTIDNGFYKGNVIKKTPENYYFVKDGIYTTCDDPHPHFCFASSRMKVIPKEQIIAEPIVFYIADLPVFMIPFAVLPSKGGRSSGILPPTYGDDSRRGRNLRGFGYYWAINDYLDINATADWFTKGGYLINSQFQYNKRYDYNGRINFSYGRQKFGIDEDIRKDWKVSINHNQTINPTTRLDVNFSFMSTDYFNNTSNNLNDLLTQNVYSTATFNKSWEGTNRSISVNLSRDQILKTNEISEVLPSITFSQGQIYPFKSKNSAEPKWYDLFGVNYNARLQSNHNKKLIDTVNFKNTYQRGINHNISMNFSPKVGNFNITPAFNYTEYWYDKTVQKENFVKVRHTTTATNPDSVYYEDSVVTRDVPGFMTTRAFNIGLSASTRFFGIFKPNVFGITGIRHTVTPSISYTITPDFWDPFFNNTLIYKNHKGDDVKYSKFEEGVFGGPGQGRNQNVGFNIGNVFEMKTEPKDTTTEETKIQLLNLNLSSSYNFAADSLKLTDAYLSYRTNILNIFDFSGSSSYSFYKCDTLGRPVNEFLIVDKQLVRLTNFQIGLSASFKGEKTKKKESTDKGNSAKEKNDETAPEEENEINKNKSGYYGLYEQEVDMDIPWNLSVGLNYNYNKSIPNHPTKQANIHANLGFNLTDNWRFDVSSYYDILTGEFSGMNLNIQRDLHCWVMNFSWIPLGRYSSFNFAIRIKAPQLQDIKVTKQGSSRGVGGY